MWKLGQAPRSIDPEILLRWVEEQFRDLEAYLGKNGRQQPYDPQWTAAGTAPSFGNSTVRGKYLEIDGWWHLNLDITFGSTATFGTGTWSFSLPRKIPDDIGSWTGSAVLVNADGNERIGVPLLETQTNATRFLIYCDNFAGPVSSTVPFTWTTSDRLIASIHGPLE